MIENLEIKNFKSIKHLKLECKRVNVFIGKPNTGKSNILESVGIFSFPYESPHGGIGLKKIVRFVNTTNLFYDNNLDDKIEIFADDKYYEIKYEGGRFVGTGGDKEKKDFRFDFNLDYDGSGSGGSSSFSPFKFYKFAVMETFPRRESDFLLPLNGENLQSILLTNKALRKTVANILNEFGLRIVLKLQEGKIEVQKEVEDVIISYPYSLISDTLQRVVFYLVAIETNKDSIIIFEEPEAHAFPYYTKFLAERIALDKTNQYFISTHNPYILSSILEKTPMKDIGIFITYYEDYQTKVKPITEEEMPLILDLDASIFFNLDKFLESK
ncbi:MAG: AAA family ATPase [Candidatus Methanoperedens sp.]|nr:AAA family ATPase [Candidatus Methanoperedens sp.]